MSIPTTILAEIAYKRRSLARDVTNIQQEISELRDKLTRRLELLARTQQTLDEVNAYIFDNNINLEDL